jgi:uncharacterized protein YbjT (DUF2867 family)
MILLTGASGVVGRQTIDQLLQAGSDVTAVTRGETPFPVGVQVARGDLFSPRWLKATLGGVDAIQVSPRATGPGLGELLRLALEQGARHVVLLSATTVESPAGEPRFAAPFKAAQESLTWLRDIAARNTLKH